MCQSRNREPMFKPGTVVAQWDDGDGSLWMEVDELGFIIKNSVGKVVEVLSACEGVRILLDLSVEFGERVLVSEELQDSVRSAMLQPDAVDMYLFYLIQG